MLWSVSGPTSQNFGSRAVIAAGATIAAAGALGLVVMHQAIPYWALCAQLAAMGAGLGLLVPPLTSTLLGSVEKSRSGVAAGSAKCQSELAREPKPSMNSLTLPRKPEDSGWVAVEDSLSNSVSKSRCFLVRFCGVSTTT